MNENCLKKCFFLDPLQQMMDKDIKEVAHHRKKLNGRRLDYDYKRGKLKSGSKGVTEDEVQMSYEKLEESIQLGTFYFKFHFVEIHAISKRYKIASHKSSFVRSWAKSGGFLYLFESCSSVEHNYSGK